MKKHTLVSLLFCSVLLTACTQGEKTNQEKTASSNQIEQVDQETLSYKDYVAPLTPIDFEELTVKMQNGDQFVLFLGRETCQYCNIFVPKLYEVLQEKSVPVYYYDTEDRDNQELIAFREKFGIETVPNLSYYEGDQLVATLEKGSQSSLEEITDLLSRLEN